MIRFWRNIYFQYTTAFLAAFFIFLLPKWEDEKIDSPTPRFLAGDTLKCAIFINNSLSEKGFTMGYIYELFRHFDNDQMCRTIIEPQKRSLSPWVKLTTAGSDMLIINSLRDTVPGIFQEEVVSSIPVSPTGEICVIEKDQFQLVQIFNHWFTWFKQTSQYKSIENKYFKSYHITTRSGELINRHTLSPYDEYIRQNAGTIGWDWRLLASLIYQESKFKAGVSSSRGAIGLMQIKESVARKYGVTDIYNPSENIKAGTLHLKRLQNMYKKMGADSLNSILITIAAYNCGEGRMSDCMRLAESEGKNPLVWDDIKEIIPLMKEEKYYMSDAVKYGKFKGKETLKYVVNILDRYDKYKKAHTEKGT